ncbi:fatty-acid amide hydrolase 2-like isoform X2 [Stegodyphus dumicola]|uniref:fatty-acid amide hydrolase 2-like isoform X2 n=1 Tax=Stegodyphus dumicola TaxID=202533 RepID=UPI0015AA47EC|nr:fatty-acid amide hydrolase 2-like isoform X2 [Stegodyphus dumicola]
MVFFENANDFTRKIKTLGYNGMATLHIKMIGALAGFVRVILTLTRPFSDKVLNFLYRICMGKTPQLPAIDDKILLMPATELAEKIRKRQLTCEEVMKAYVMRIKLVQPIINAVVDERYVEALNDAMEVDRFLASGQKSEKDIAQDTPLLGVPFTCKEAIGVKGLAQTCGQVRDKDRKAVKDSDTAALYRKAGAIPVTVTNVPELCMWWESANHVFGMTKNPYDIRRTVGGSSGGEGALITAAGAAMGIGNDIAGSIRIPSSFCGIYGHKPSRDIISNKGTWPESDDEYDVFVSTGPMCRYVQDLLLLVRVLSDNDQRLKLDEKVNFRNVKVYYMEEVPGFLHSAIPPVKAAIRKAAKHFEDEYGITATKVNIEELAYGFNIWESKLLECGGPSFASMLASEDKGVNLTVELIKSLFCCSDHTWPAIYFGMVDMREKNKYYYTCLEKYNTLKTKFEELLQGDVIFLLPTHPEPPPHYLLTIPKYPNIVYTCIFNILGYPSSQIPTGLHEGVPIGIQAISRQFQDHLTLAAALELDNVFNGWISPCPISVQ